MTLKSKLIATISAFCLVVGMLIAGVWASLHVQVEMGGDLIFTATDVNVRVSGKIEGMETTEESGVMNLPTITFSANPDENSPSTVLDQWKNNALTFTQAGDDITITITIENLSDRIVNVKVKDSVGASAGIDKIIKNGTTIESATEVASGASVQLSGNSITYYTITLSLKDRNNSLASGVKYGYTIDLSDSSYVAPLAYSNDETLGEVSYPANYQIGDEVTLSANFAGPNAEFLGWAKDSADGEIVADSMEYTFTYDETSAEKYYAIFQDLNNSSLAYELSSDGTDTASVKAKEKTISGDIMIPSTIYKEEIKYDVTSVAEMGFAQCNNLDKIVIPTSVSVIESGAFGASSIKNVIISEGVSTISMGAFTVCTQLKNVTLPKSLIELGDLAFNGCSSLTSINLKGVSTVGESAFYECTGLTSIELPESITSIGDNAFYSCTSLISMSIKSTNPPIIGSSFIYSDVIQKIFVEEESLDFYKSAWTNYADKIFSINKKIEDENFVYYVKDDNSLEVVGFNNGQKAEVVVPMSLEGKSVTSIGDFAFFYCNNLLSIELPNTIKTIGVGAFYVCSNLKNIEIPESVMSIGEAAFAVCGSLTSLIIYAVEPPELGKDAFIDANSSLIIYVPSTSYDKYLTEWANYSDKIEKNN